MYLRRLELYGFKTFADRTELHFGPGITAIVGPNGSGKSNLADAILWVLGEQSMRSLRSSRASDVIFAGSDGKRPVGLAEVTLTLDNLEGTLPLDYSEVSVTRRVYRSGEGEYLLNKSPVRLRDIQDLFLDTGLGKEAYSVITQSQVDAVLSARPEDRRALVEEAAGIQKYRHRKREALGKLERTRANLDRVNDIISELESSLAPLATQSEQARTYRALAREQRELKLALLLQRHHQLAEGLARTAEREQEANQQIESLRTHAATLAAREATLRQELATREERLEAARAACTALTAESEKATGQEALARQSLEHLDSRQEALRQECEALEGELREGASAVARLQAESDQLARTQADLGAEVQAREAALAQAEQQLRAAAGDAAQLRTEYLRLADELTSKHNLLAQCDSILRAAAARLDRLAARQAALEQARAAAAAERSRFVTALDRLQLDRQSLESDLERNREALEEARAALARQSEETAALRQDLSARESRLAALVELEEAREGYYPGVRAVLTASAQGELAGSYQAVAEVVRVPARYQQAIEVALGASVQDIVTPDQHLAQEAIAYLKRTRAGRATFLPLTLLRPAPRLAPRSPTADPDCLGVAVDLVNFDSQHRPVFEHLLGRVLVAPTLEAALRLAGREQGWRRIVTLEGELVHPAGPITGGAAGKPSQLLGRRREIEDLGRMVAALRGELERAQGEEQHWAHRLEQAAAQRQRLAEASAEMDRVLAHYQADLRACQAELERAASELEEVAVEAASLKQDADSARAQHTELEQAVSDLETRQRALEAALGRTEESLREEQQARDTLAAALLAVHTEHASLAARCNAAQVAIKRENERLAGRAQVLEARRQELAAVADQRQELLAELATRGGHSGRLAADLAAAEQALEQAREERQRTLDQVAACVEAQAVNRSELEAAQERLHRAQLRSTQQQTELALLQAQLEQDYQLNAQQAEAQYRPVERVEDHRARLAELEEAIAALGEVNLGAVEEYDRVSARLEFLTRERQDLERAQADLEQVIAQIDRTSSQRYLETLAAVGEHFQQIFTRLFSGGDTSLVVTDPADPLESGLEVHVTVPGKRTQNLLLLSGGERALTAVALLFALLSVRPAPFVVLDEIDAPLDEANVSRFTDLLSDFATRSQFLVITHNKATIEAADTIYGVSMEKPGVSRLLGLRLADLE